MKVRFLAPHEVPAEFDRLKPLFDRVPGKDEYSTGDIAEQGSLGNIAIGYAEEKGVIVAAMAFEFVRYLQMDAVNIVALAGEKLDDMHHELFEEFRLFCRQAGAKCIEARCSDVMARLLRRYGFVKKHSVVRCEV